MIRYAHEHGELWSSLTTSDQYSSRGKAYILPDFSGKPEVIIPNSEIRWLLDQVGKSRCYLVAFT
jgi:hypothetical protein